jgi:proteasome accessory factor C
MADKTSSADRARRLLALLAMLAGGSVPLRELARRLGTDTATVSADLVLLSVCGADSADPGALVPVLVEGTDAVVFGALPALEEPVRLSASEAGALLAALDACGAGPGTPLAARLRSIASRTLDLDQVVRTVRTAVLPGGSAHIHALLSAAAGGRRVTRLNYVRTGEDSPEERTVHPEALFLERGSWYLSAWDERRSLPRTFRLDRILDAQVTGIVFQPHDDPTTGRAAPDAAGLPRAEVRFRAETPDMTDRVWPGATFEHLPDGSVRAMVPYAGTAWIARRIVSRLGDAVAVEPAEVREAVASLARAAVDRT